MVWKYYLLCLSALGDFPIVPNKLQCFMFLYEADKAVWSCFQHTDYSVSCFI